MIFNFSVKAIEAIYDLFLFNEEIKAQLNETSNKVFQGKLYLIIIIGICIFIKE